MNTVPREIGQAYQMNQPKLLNLDDFQSAQKVLTLDGVQHEMREMTVQEFIDKASQARADQAAAGEMTLEEQVEKAVEMIHDAFPTVTKERLRKLRMQQLTVLIDFVIKAPEQIEADAKASQGNE